MRATSFSIRRSVKSVGALGPSAQPSPRARGSMLGPGVSRSDTALSSFRERLNALAHSLGARASHNMATKLHGSPRRLSLLWLLVHCHQAGLARALLTTLIVSIECHRLAAIPAGLYDRAARAGARRVRCSRSCARPATEAVHRHAHCRLRNSAAMD